MMGLPEARDVSALPNLFSEIQKDLGVFSWNSRLVLVLDYDGTLTDIVDNPAAAILPRKRHSTLLSLAQKDCVAVWIVSGRDMDFLTSQFGDSPSPIGLVAEHGGAVRVPGTSHWDKIELDCDWTWMDHVELIFSEAVKSVPHTWIERKRSTIAWHWRKNPLAAAPIASELGQDIVSKSQGWNAKLQVIEGKCVLEVRCVGISKGRNLRKIMADLGESLESTKVVCAGDDTTDEDMFRAIKADSVPAENDFSIRVLGQDKTSDRTYASYWVADPSELWQVIDCLVGRQA